LVYSFPIKHSVHPFWLFRCAQNVTANAKIGYEIQQ
jgi:hypothetical protein